MTLGGSDVSELWVCSWFARGCPSISPDNSHEVLLLTAVRDVHAYARRSVSYENSAA